MIGTPTTTLRLLKRNDDNPPVLQQMFTRNFAHHWENEWRDVPVVAEGSDEDKLPAAPPARV